MPLTDQSDQSAAHGSRLPEGRQDHGGLCNSLRYDSFRCYQILVQSYFCLNFIIDHHLLVIGTSQGHYTVAQVTVCIQQGIIQPTDMLSCSFNKELYQI